MIVQKENEKQTENKKNKIVVEFFSVKITFLQQQKLIIKLVLGC